MGGRWVVRLLHAVVPFVAEETQVLLASSVLELQIPSEVVLLEGGRLV